MRISVNIRACGAKGADAHRQTEKELRASWGGERDTATVLRVLPGNNSVLATPNQVACANSGEGVSVVILYNAWRDSILNSIQKNEVQVLFPASLAECLAGFRVRRLLAETTSSLAADFYQSSGVWRSIAEFPDRQRVIHLITPESVRTVSGSLGNIIFRFHQPLLRLRLSDQQLLLAALQGTTDYELAAKLGITLAA